MGLTDKQRRNGVPDVPAGNSSTAQPGPVFDFAAAKAAAEAKGRDRKSAPKLQTPPNEGSAKARKYVGG